MGHFGPTLKSYLLYQSHNCHVTQPDYVLSDGAGQFRLFEHALCWVHAERLINRLIPITNAQRQAVETVQDQLWDFYQELKTYKTLNPQQQQQLKASLEERFEKIFTQTTLERNPQPSSEKIIQAKN